MPARHSIRASCAILMPIAASHASYIRWLARPAERRITRCGHLGACRQWAAGHDVLSRSRHPRWRCRQPPRHARWLLARAISRQVSSTCHATPRARREAITPPPRYFSRPCRRVFAATLHRHAVSGSAHRPKPPASAARYQQVDSLSSP